MSVHTAHLDTEQHNPLSHEIELQETSEILRRINEEDQKVALAVQKCLPQIAPLVDAVVHALSNNGRLIYVGAGTSGRLGILDASECHPTYGVDPNLVIGLIAGGIEALTSALEGAEDNKILAQDDLRAINLTPQDVVVGIAASGRTPYVLGALEFAQEMGCTTGSIACTHSSDIARFATHAIHCPVGAEIVTGSTRMKAGTAQKLILNMISTTTMIKLGKVFNGYMVDVQCTNEKLVERATRIVENTTECSHDKAKESLEKSQYNTKLAILSVLSNLEPDEAQNLLAVHNHNIAQAIRGL